MTNREWLNTRTNEEFAIEVTAKLSQFEVDNFDPNYDIFDFTDDTRIDFEIWLGEEHKEDREQ